MKRTLVALAALGAGWCWANFSTAQEAPPPPPVPAAVADPGPAPEVKVELLTRGPIHEAFAQAVTPTSEPGLLVAKEPPPLIEEIPPAQRPSGDDVAWIPGYWGYDDERNDFIWISGVWRAVPPGRDWVPGYWAKVTEGYRWVSGYWADTRTTEVEYLPAPPETAEAGPSTPAPTGTEIWVPGCWMWQQNKYVWRAGYWAKGHPEWMWTSAHYVATPRSYVYVSGYWDFLLPQRGLLFAPVYIQGPIVRSFIYSPRLVIDTRNIVDHLFLRPTYHHYYFGDYYAANYRTSGILPWFMFNNNKYGYDPIYSYNRWRYRDDSNWERTLVTRYDAMRDRNDGRPPRTWADWQKIQDRDNNRSFIGGTITDFAKTSGKNFKFRDYSDVDRRNAGQIARDLDKFRQSRLKLETEQAARRNDDDRGPDRIELLKPPIGDPRHRPMDVVIPPRNERDPADVRPNLDSKPERSKLDRLDEKPLKPGSIPVPGLDGRKSAMPRGPVERTPDAREFGQPPKNPVNLPGPLNDIRNPPGKNGEPPPRIRVERDTPGPMNDIRDRKKDSPKGPPKAPKADREDRRTPENPVAIPPPKPMLP